MVMPLPLDFETNEQRVSRKNFAAVKKEIEDRDDRLADRIALFSYRSGIPEEEFWQALEANPTGPLAAVLAKEARRQNIHENATADYLREFPFVDDFVKLPTNGNKALYINAEGQIVSGQDLGKAELPSKSIDFRWRTGHVTCYAAQKYTKEGGGTQDNQFKEVETLLKHFLPRRNNDTALFILVDGPYYTDIKLTQLRGLARLQSPFSYVTSVNEIFPILQVIAETG